VVTVEKGDRHVTSTMCSKSYSVILAALIASACFALPNAKAQEIAVQNESGATVRLTASDIAALPHQAVTAEDHGQKVKFEGVPLRALLEKAGLTFGESLRGKRMAECLLVEGADGYHVVFALPELDPGFMNKVILLADKADGHALDSKQGPFRVVVPGEMRMARWVRQVTVLKVVPVQ
jgi:hypothetical protein